MLFSDSVKKLPGSRSGFRGLLDPDHDQDFWLDPGSMNTDPKQS